MIYIRKDIPIKALNKHVLPEHVEAVFLELNLRKQKWLLCMTYHLPSQKEEYYFYLMCKAVPKFLLTRDFNAEVKEPCSSKFSFEFDTI